MATIIAPFTPVDGSGNVYASAKLYFYETGTSTPQNTFSDSALSVTNTNPVVADSNGLFSAIYLGDPPDFETYKAVLKTSADVTVWTADPIAGAPITVPVSASLLRGYISGLQRTANTATTLSIGAGVCADSTSTVMLSLAAGTIDCATVGADGLDAGALAVTTTYHAFAIGKTDGTVARLASTSVSSPTLPSGYSYKRRMQSFKTNVSAQIINGSQVGDSFFLSATITDNIGFSITTAATLRTLPVPTGIKVRALFRATAFGASSSGIAFYSPEQATQAHDTTNGNSSLTWNGSAQAAGNFDLMTDTSARIGAVGPNGVGVYSIATFGWIDHRGKDD
jgi:hypothetical protein